MSNKPLRPGKKTNPKKKCRWCELLIEESELTCFWCGDLIRKGWIPPVISPEENARWTAWRKGMILRTEKHGLAPLGEYLNSKGEVVATGVNDEP